MSDEIHRMRRRIEAPYQSESGQGMYLLIFGACICIIPLPRQYPSSQALEDCWNCGSQYWSIVIHCSYQQEYEIKQVAAKRVGHDVEAS